MADDSEDWSALVAAQENEVGVKVINSFFNLSFLWLLFLKTFAKKL